MIIEKDLEALMNIETNSGRTNSFRRTKKDEPDKAIEDFDHNLSLLIHTIKKLALTKRPCKWSKPW